MGERVAAQDARKATKTRHGRGSACGSAVCPALVIDPELVAAVVGESGSRCRAMLGLRPAASGPSQQPGRASGAGAAQAMSPAVGRDTTFARFGYLDAFTRTIAAFPALERLRRVVVHVARRPAEEGCCLRRLSEAGGCEAEATVRVVPVRFQDGVSLSAFLRFHWLQIEDRLDPAFGADAHREAAPLLVEAYELAWAIYTDGRLRRRGWSPPAEHAARPARLRRLAGPDGPITSRRVIRKLQRADFLTQDALWRMARAVCATGRLAGEA